MKKWKVLIIPFLLLLPLTILTSAEMKRENVRSAKGDILFCITPETSVYLVGEPITIDTRLIAGPEGATFSYISEFGTNCPDGTQRRFELTSEDGSTPKYIAPHSYWGIEVDIAKLYDFTTVAKST